MEITELFAGHVDKCQSLLGEIVGRFNLEGLVLASGPQQYYYMSDHEIPFRSSHYFNYWCPLEGEHHVLVLSPGKKPLLLHYQPDDFWYDHQPLRNEFWLNFFEIKSFSSRESIWKELENYKNFHYLGPDLAWAMDRGYQALDEKVLYYINWHRCYKSAYEAFCVEKATASAAMGHRAAKSAFIEGGSELDIHLAYLSASRNTDKDLPYNAIVGLNQKAAVLHYAEKRDDIRNAQVLLIDSGARFSGYCSDITRTYTARDVSAEFNHILEAMNHMQLELCASIELGKGFGEIHHESHLSVAKVLLDAGILQNLSIEELVDRSLTKVFYPHGVGHMLGLLVHDVGGKQKDDEGTPFESPKHPTLRAGRTIEPGFLFTIEPGLYFIEMLLAPHRTGENKQYFDWGLIDRLMPYGGIRIEDNLYVTKSGVKNITRQYLP